MAGTVLYLSKAKAAAKAKAKATSKKGAGKGKKKGGASAAAKSALASKKQKNQSDSKKVTKDKSKREKAAARLAEEDFNSDAILLKKAARVGRVGGEEGDELDTADSLAYDAESIESDNSAAAELDGLMEEDGVDMPDVLEESGETAVGGATQQKLFLDDVYSMVDSVLTHVPKNSLNWSVVTDRQLLVSFSFA